MTGRTLSRQPDDPGIDPINPHAPVIFRRTGFGQRELILLGAVQIGELAPAPGRMVRASVRLLLPGVARSMFGFSSMKVARERIADQVREWIDAAGLRA